MSLKSIHAFSGAKNFILKSLKYSLTKRNGIDKIINVAYKTASFETVNLSVKRKLFPFGKGGYLFWKIN